MSSLWLRSLLNTLFFFLCGFSVCVFFNWKTCNSPDCSSMEEFPKLDIKINRNQWFGESSAKSVWIMWCTLRLMLVLICAKLQGRVTPSVSASPQSNWHDYKKCWPTNCMVIFLGYNVLYSQFLFLLLYLANYLFLLYIRLTWIRSCWV